MNRRASLLRLTLGACMAQAALCGPFPGIAAAQNMAPDLPPSAAVIASLDRHPSVEAATARLHAAEAQARMLSRGPHEITLNGVYSRRDVQDERSYNEYDASITRPFRLPGKASLDRKAGEYGVDAAHNQMEDVRHQTAILLSTLWYDWLAAEETARTDKDIVIAQEKALIAIERRVALRDAAPLDAEQAASALALTRAQLAESRSRAAEALALLSAQFPDLPLPDAAPTIALPAVPAEGFENLAELVVKRSHEIGAALAVSDQQEAFARRAKADRIADPSFGFRLFSERGGMEKGAGLIANIPLGGGYRAGAADQAAATASSARLELASIRRSIDALARADASNARTRMIAWGHMKDAVARALDVLDRTERGYRLGAIDLTDLLYAQRQTNETRRAEIAARAEARRALIRLEIDSHKIWMGEDVHEDE